jgi:hypothetical protein
LALRFADLMTTTTTTMTTTMMMMMTTITMLKRVIKETTVAEAAAQQAFSPALPLLLSAFPLDAKLNDETELHIDRDVSVRRVDRAQMNVTRAIAPLKINTQESTNERKESSRTTNCWRRQ